jgi:hypothetical protein
MTIRKKVSSWVTFNWWRMATQAVGWLAALRALSLRHFAPDSRPGSRPDRGAI